MSNDQGLIGKAKSLSTSKPRLNFSENLMLIGAGYNECWLDAFNSAAVELALPIMHLPLFKGIQYGTGFGDEDFYLSDIFNGPAPNVLIIPAGEESLKSLLVDPRVHQLMQKTVAQSGRVAFGEGAELLLSTIPEVLRLTSNHIYFQRNTPTYEFALKVLAS